MAHSLIGRFPKVNIIDTCVCIYSSTGIMLFDNRNGKFIRKIGTKGRGPGEYSLPTSVCNEEQQTSYLLGHNSNLMEFSFSGDLCRIIKVPYTYRSKNNNKRSVAEKIFPFNDSLYCAFFPNTFGQEKKKIVVFDTAGKIIRLFPNQRIIPGYNTQNMGYRMRGEWYILSL